MCLASNNWNEWLLMWFNLLSILRWVSHKMQPLSKWGKLSTNWKGAGKWEETTTNVFCLWLDDIFFPWLTLLLRNLILCYIWTSLYNGRPLGHIKRINVISLLMMMMMMMLVVVVIDSVTYVWALYMGCVSTHGAERHIWHTWLRLLLLLFSFFSTFDFVDDVQLRLWYTLSLPCFEDRVVIIKSCRARKPCAELA